VELFLGSEFSESFPLVFCQSLFVAVLAESHSFTFVHIFNLPQIKYFYQCFLEIFLQNRQKNGRRPFLHRVEKRKRAVASFVNGATGIRSISPGVCRWSSCNCILHC
jgi:hypothetical protein